ncbi:MAG: YkgJ family cysteine cluster protein, partial [Armatimonadota bacterium]
PRYCYPSHAPRRARTTNLCYNYAMDHLITDLDTIRRIVQAEEQENIRFRQYLQYELGWSDLRLDAFVQEIAGEIAAAIDCIQCAHCCRALEVSVEDEDLVRLAEHLGTTPAQVEAAYTAPGKQCDRAFARHPCAFLRDNRCTVYPARTRDCREYPHLDKADFRARMWQTLTHAEDCPIVFHTLQRLKRELWKSASLEHDAAR